MNASGFPSATTIWHSSTYPAIFPSRPELSLVGQSVVITGGGSGIGFAISQSVALAGASKLAIIGRRISILEEAKASIHHLVGDKTEVFIVSADIGIKDEVDLALSKISKAFDDKPLDILINNAGYYSGLRPFGTETAAEWQMAVDINVKGVYNITTAFIAKARPDATLINITSAVGHIAPFFGYSAYATTKLAGARLFECIHHEKPELHIVNIHPGRVVETDMAKKLSTTRPHIDDADLAGNFVVWTASQEAKFLKGKYVWVNWDVDELKERKEMIQSTPAYLTIGLEGFSSFLVYDK